MKIGLQSVRNVNSASKTSLKIKKYFFIKVIPKYTPHRKGECVVRNRRWHVNTAVSYQYLISHVRMKSKWIDV